MKHKTTHVKLKNGASGLFIHIPNATVMTFDVNFRAGEYLVKPDKWEVPHLMEHVLLGANKKYPKARDFQAELEKNGAYSNASTGVYDITYEAECADFEWDRVLDLMLTAISKPLFLEDEFASEYGNVQEEMTARSNDHFRKLNLKMRKELGLLAKTDRERLKLMKNVSVEDVRKHYKRTHHTPNMRFIIAGKLTMARRAEILEMLENISLPKSGQRIELPQEVPNNLVDPVYVSNSNVENIYFYLDTFLNRRLKDPEADALDLVNMMLTGTLYSKILGTARERGLVYGMSSGIGYTKDASSWWFGAQVSEKNAPALFHIIKTELTKMLNGEISDEEIDNAKQYALGRFQRSAQTVGGIASGYSFKYFFDNQVEDYDKVPERIRAITKEQIVSITNAMFKQDVWGIGFLGNCGMKFARSLQEQISPLWSDEIIKK